MRAIAWSNLAFFNVAEILGLPGFFGNLRLFHHHVFKHINSDALFARTWPIGSCRPRACFNHTDRFLNANIGLHCLNVALFCRFWPDNTQNFFLCLNLGCWGQRELWVCRMRLDVSSFTVAAVKWQILGPWHEFFFIGRFTSRAGGQSLHVLWLRALPLDCCELGSVEFWGVLFGKTMLGDLRVVHSYQILGLRLMKALFCENCLRLFYLRVRKLTFKAI